MKCPHCYPEKDYHDYMQYPFHIPFRGMPPDPRNHATFFDAKKHHIHQHFCDNTYGITEKDFTRIDDLCIKCVESALTYLIITLAQHYYYNVKFNENEHKTEVLQINAYLKRFNELTGKDHEFEYFNEGGG